MRFVSLPVTLWGAASIALFVANGAPLLAPPTDIQQPGTQPLQATLLPGVLSCAGCHGFYDPDVEMHENWQGSMMAQAGRDPVFWAALAIADSDIPGAGDYCIRCHSPRGWHEGRAGLTDGSGLDQSTDQDGIECAICHNMVNPDHTEHLGMQTPPFMANDGGLPPEGFYGSGMVVLAGNQTRYGPYGNATAGHAWAQSQFHRSSKICGTCHEVSNPFVGDLAAGNGAQIPLAPGTFSGVLGDPVTAKAAFNNPPYKYGIVERTFSEHVASALSTTPISAYNTLPADIQRGAIQRAHQQALLAGTGGDYEDGQTRFFNCQSCHMEPVVGEGAAFGIAPLRYDLPKHDLTGGNTWVPDAIRWLDNQVPSKLRLGAGITPSMSAAMDRGILRARATLQRAGALDITGDTLRVTNLTGHKLITGYPEGRRMWLRTRWRDELGNLLREDGAYTSFTANVNGTPYTVNSITDPNARIYQAKPGISQDWALQLLLMGVSPTLPLRFDPVTGAVTLTLAQLAAAPPGTEVDTFHFVLNNRLLSDTRIPPYGFSRDAAELRNALPVPASQYGNPAPGGTYQHFDDVALSPPAGATRADVELLYQTSSWEYIQFLLLANPGTSAFLATAGSDLFDAWRNTGQSAPEVMAKARWCNLPGTNEDLVLKTSINGAPLDETCGKDVRVGDTMNFEVSSPLGQHQFNLGALFVQFHDLASPPLLSLPGVWIDHWDWEAIFFGVPPAGWTLSLVLPPGVPGEVMRWQAAALGITTPVANGLFATSDAHDLWQR
ncbi:MAG: hypothetical protein KF830_10800 [Planctomycetes bacterium]|nr:hypothetical protein [Planctomycetota bacterium]